MDEHNRCELEVDVAQVAQNGRPIGSWLCCLPCYWLKRNNSFHKASLTVVTLLVTVLLVASPVIFLISSVPGNKSRDCLYHESDCGHRGDQKVCLEKQCLLAAKRILASISWKTNPCQDFYHFACGSWAKRKKVPKETESAGSEDPFFSFETLQRNVDQTIQQLLAGATNSDHFQKLGLFYKSCLRAGDKKVTLLPMLALLDDLGGYVPPKADPPQDLTNLVLSLLRLNGAPLFDIYLDSDLHNSSKMAPVIDLPLRFGFSTRFWWYQSKKDYFNDIPLRFASFSKVMTAGDEFASAAFTHVKNLDKSQRSLSKAYNFLKATLEEKRLLVMEKIMREFMAQNLTADARIKETHNTLHFANMITKLYPTEKEVIKNYQVEINEKMKLTDLQRKYPFVQWKYLLEEFLNIRFTAEDPVFVLAPAYLNNLQRILSRFNSRVIHNGLLLIFATDTLYELVNTSLAYSWPEFCTKITVQVFSKAVSVLFVLQYGSEYLDHIQEEGTRIFQTLKKTFKDRIERMSWLDEMSREAVTQKLAALNGQFLSWPEFWNETQANALLEDVTIEPDNFFGNVIRRYQQLRSVPLNFQLEQSEEKRWAYPFVVNAFYILTMNTIIIPLAVLTQPYLQGDLPLYIPYSTIGLIFAHEILHGFDLKGIGYDSKGNRGALLSGESRARLEARLDCFVKQFSSTFLKKINFLGTNIDIQFDWNMTKNENMADISGLQIAYQAWKSVAVWRAEATLPGVSLNAQQLFFLNAAQTYCSAVSPEDYIFLVEMDFHTPHPERVNGIMMNSPGFAEAFKCPSGSSMNPRKKCSTW